MRTLGDLEALVLAKPGQKCVIELRRGMWEIELRRGRGTEAVGYGQDLDSAVDDMLERQRCDELCTPHGPDTGGRD